MRSRRKKSKINKVVRNSILKILVFSIIVALNWAGLSAVGKTIAYFVDNEDSNANLYQAGILDFSLSSPADFSPSNITPCIPVSRDISIINNGNIFQYTVQVTELSGELCDYLDLTANLDGGDPEYNDSLASFNYGPVEFSDPEDWNFVVNLTGNDLSLQNKDCQFKFVFEGWQINLPDSSAGYSDIEEITNTVATGDWLPQVMVIYPNGGEVWYMVPPGYAHPGLGIYEILWEATSQVYNQSELLIDIWFCKESGADCFYQIANDTENDGSYWWTIPYESRFITDEGRIKIIATDPCSFTGEDMSDTDFCPPMLTEAQVLEMLALMTEPLEEEFDEEPIIKGESATEEEPTDEEIPADEEIPVSEGEIITEGEGTEEETVLEETTEETTEDSTEEGTEETTEDIGDEEVEEEPPVEEGSSVEEATEEVTTEENQEGGIIEEINEIIDEVVEEIVDELMPDEETGEEVVSEPEVPVIDDSSIIEEAPADEAPAVEEQPAVIPDESSSTQDGSGESVGDGGSGDGGSVDGGGPVEGAGESSGDSGVDAGSESVSE